MALDQSIITVPQSGVCTCAIGDRCAVYGGLSAMLLAPALSVADAVRRVSGVMESCPSFEYLDRTEINLVAEQAISALQTPAGVAAFAEERTWLFGDTEFDPFVNGMAPTEATYLTSDRDELRRTLETTYSMAGFRPPDCGPLLPCLGHMGVELDFMRHCLEQVTWGDERFIQLARSFFGDHLREWGVLFAVVLRDKARHAALRYLSFALDQFIVTESIVFRQSLPALCVQRSLAE